MKTPPFPAAYASDGFSCDLILIRQRPSCPSSQEFGANIPSLFWTQLHSRVRHAATALLVHVGDVFCIRAGENVSRVAAGWCVAAVACAKVPEYRAIDILPCDAMGSNVSSLHLDASVPVESLTCLPQPTAVWMRRFIHFRPESFHIIEGILRVHSMSFHRVPCLGVFAAPPGPFAFSQLYQITGGR